MKRKIWMLTLVGLCLLALWGCQRKGPAENTEPLATEAVISATVPPDGDPENATCKGTYTGSGSDKAIAATVGDAMLTNGQLRAWYAAEIAQYRQENHEINPDYTAPLDTQACPIDDSVNSWQQYFLQEALNRWHGAQVMEIVSRTDKLEKDPAYDPDQEELIAHMEGMPVTDILYGYYDYYQPNSMHQSYLDNIPTMLDTLAADSGYADAQAMAEAAFGTDLDEVESFVQLYNYGYTYYTFLGYDLEAEEAAAAGEKRVDIRQILLVPDPATDWKGNVLDPVTVGSDGKVTCSETLWEKCETQAKKLLKQLDQQRFPQEKVFRELAYQNSEDKASSENGGIYNGIRQGQLITELDSWCFDTARQVGDTAILRSDYGVHILYFAGISVQQDTEELLQALVTNAKNRFPMAVNYSAIVLTEPEALLSYDDILYPDVAHERYPEVPLYLQQSYGELKYGSVLLNTHGCGITIFSMLSSYMMDEEYTPAEMCEQFRRYSYGNGTDGMIYIYESATMGYYMLERTFDSNKAYAALEAGHIVVSVQSPGYWTTGGHYIMLEKLAEDGKVQVRDTNMPNYAKIPAHAEDKHAFKDITSSNAGYWIMQKKVKTIPFCSRCGDGEGVLGLIDATDYVCEKCQTALNRRNVWLGI